MIKILDLYCGMGGLSLGFALALENIEILGLDIDARAVETYNYNLSRFNARAVIQDILEWSPGREYDAVIGGPPCQPFSIANTKKKGREHPLYPTFPRFFDIVLELKPRVFLMENVKGLVTRRHKPLFDEQLKRLEPYYHVKWQVLNAAHYGVPQRRERLFVLGIRKDLGIVPSFPSPTHAEKEHVTVDGRRVCRWVTVREAIGDLLTVPPLNYPKKLVQTNPRHGKPIDLDTPSRTVKVDGRGGDFTFDTMLVPLTITEHVVANVKVDTANPKGFGDASKVPNKLDLPAKTVMKGGGSGGAIPPLVELPSEHVMTEKGGWANPKSDWGSRIIDQDKPSYTITEKHRSGQLVEIPGNHEARKHVKYRRLTVRECLRLQSFPDWWSFPSHTSISRKYKLVGEAVPPILAYRLAVHIGKLMGWKTREPPRREEWQLPYFDRAFTDYFRTENKN